MIEEAKSRASEEGAKIVAAAHAEAAQESTKARETLREQVAALAVRGAEQILRREVDAKTHADLVRPAESAALSPWPSSPPSLVPTPRRLLKGFRQGDNAVRALWSRSALSETVAADPQLRQFADSPKILPAQVFDMITSVARTSSGAPLGEHAKNLLRAVIDNGRLAALPEIATQFQALVDAKQRHVAGDDRERLPDQRRAGRRGEGGDGASVPAQSRRPRRRSSPS